MVNQVCPGQMYFGMGIGWLFQIVIFVVFFLVVWWLIRNNQPVSVERKQPLDILKCRLASGEISQKEYEKLKSEID